MIHYFTRFLIVLLRTNKPESNNDPWHNGREIRAIRYAMSTSLAQSFQPTYIEMADDTMEISSDAGHNGDDDIDIDIDYTAGPGDEDDILEDVQSDIDIEESMELQDSQDATEQDDIMIDEDNGSVRINDAELDRLSSFPHTQYQSDLPDVAVVMNTMEPELSDVRAADDLHAGPDELATDANRIITEINTEGTVQHEDSHSERDKSLLKAEDLQAQAPTEAIHDEKSLESIGVTGAHVTGESFQHTAEDTAESDVKFPVAEDDSALAPIIQTSAPLEVHEQDLEDGTPAGSLFDMLISVTYQDTEYTLFPTTTVDDPDSFFLDDRSILDKNLGDLLAALREVLHDDLSPGDELCISIDNLGLEIYEVKPYCPPNLLQADTCL